MQDIFFANIEEIKLKCVQNSLIQTTFVIVNNYSNLMPVSMYLNLRIQQETQGCICLLEGFKQNK